MGRQNEGSPYRVLRQLKNPNLFERFEQFKQCNKGTEDGKSFRTAYESIVRVELPVCEGKQCHGKSPHAYTGNHHCEPSALFRNLSVVFDRENHDTYGAQVYEAYQRLCKSDALMSDLDIGNLRNFYNNYPRDLYRNHINGVADAWEMLFKGLEVEKCFKLLDRSTVEDLELRAPQLSTDDSRYINENAHRWFANFSSSEREAIIGNLRKFPSLIPTLRTLSTDMRILDGVLPAIQNLLQTPRIGLREWKSEWNLLLELALLYVNDLNQKQAYLEKHGDSVYRAAWRRLRSAASGLTTVSSDNSSDDEDAQPAPLEDFPCCSGDLQSLEVEVKYRQGRVGSNLRKQICHLRWSPTCVSQHHVVSPLTVQASKICLFLGTNPKSINVRTTEHRLLCLGIMPSGNTNPSWNSRAPSSTSTQFLHEATQDSNLPSPKQADTVSDNLQRNAKESASCLLIRDRKPLPPVPVTSRLNTAPSSTTDMLFPQLKSLSFPVSRPLDILKHLDFPALKDGELAVYQWQSRKWCLLGTTSHHQLPSLFRNVRVVSLCGCFVLHANQISSLVKRLFVILKPTQTGRRLILPIRPASYDHEQTLVRLELGSHDSVC